MINKGTIEGVQEEIWFTALLNRKTEAHYWNKLNLSSKNHYAVRVITKKYGTINEAKIMCKADIFIASGYVPLNDLLSKEYYLDERDLSDYNLKPIEKTGISVKRRDSNKFQIHKMVPNTFKKLFGSTILGAGSSIYCMREEELIKNSAVLEGWQTNWGEFSKFFSSLIEESVSHESDIETFKKIKTISNKLIKEKIQNDKSLSDFIFKGKGNFEEPFTAEYLLEHNDFKKNYAIPFNITTGSGRSNGKYTIVLKPR